jgi:hypothetical protein
MEFALNFALLFISSARTDHQSECALFLRLNLLDFGFEFAEVTEFGSSIRVHHEHVLSFCEFNPCPHSASLPTIPGILDNNCIDLEFP